MKKKAYKEPYIDLELLLTIYEIDGRINNTGYTGVSNNSKIEYQCTNCYKKVIKSVESLRRIKFSSLLCQSCNLEKTCIERFGVSNPSKTIEYKNNKDKRIEKSRNTCIERFGVSNPSKSNTIKEKKKETFLNHYGVDNYSKSIEHKNNIESIIEKSKETCKKKYGKENYAQTEEYKERIRTTCLLKYGTPHYTQSNVYKDNVSRIVNKRRETCKERYGVDNYAKLAECHNKIKNTCNERYGKANYTQTDEYKKQAIKTCREKFGADYYSQSEFYKSNLPNIISKYIETCRSKYGVENYSQTLESHKHRKTRIFYNGEYFDSKPELEFYKKCLLENKSIIRHPIKLEYVYENKTHSYYPDFSVDGILIEIKGKQFLNEETNKWYNPFDRSQDKKYEAKYDCSIKNNVKIIYV